MSSGLNWSKSKDLMIQQAWDQYNTWYIEYWVAGALLQAEFCGTLAELAVQYPDAQLVRRKDVTHS